MKNYEQEINKIRKEKQSLEIINNFLDNLKKLYLCDFKKLIEEYELNRKNIEFSLTSNFRNNNDMNYQGYFLNAIWIHIENKDFNIFNENIQNRKTISFLKKVKKLKNIHENLNSEFNKNLNFQKFFIGNEYESGFRFKYFLEYNLESLNRYNVEKSLNYYEEIIKEKEDKLLKKELIILQKKDIEENKIDRKTLIDDNKTIRELTFVLALGVFLNVFYFIFDLIERTLNLDKSSLLFSYALILLVFILMGVIIVKKIFPKETSNYLWFMNINPASIFLAILIGFSVLPIVLLIFSNSLTSIVEDSENEITINVDDVNPKNNTKTQEIIENLSIIQKEMEELKSQDNFNISK